ncbi:MAG: NAD(P)H-hydrate epimerase [Elusimicrobia bacterium RIFCSPHIGHO2_02_FULL_57_9]|nr:MAG: NAD(P)H-hydrate epimerase [Elusimicrobia bacterium RIFCSPHIGHO2_02_FULL_57_9]
MELPLASAEQMRELDRLAAQKFNLPVLQLMENAGQAVASEAAAYIKNVLKRQVGGAPIAVCCGRGANGGDGLVAARILREMGAKVHVVICPSKKETAYPQSVSASLERAKAAGVEVSQAGPEAALGKILEQSVLILDALLGTGSSGKPAGAIHHMIQEITKSKKPVLAVDIPSGLHPDTGYHSGVYVTAAVTLTLGLPKRGLLAPHARKYVGALKVLDIGYPPALVAQLFAPK